MIFLNIFDMESINSPLLCLFNWMQKFSYNGNVYCMSFSVKHLLLRKEILKGFGKVLKIITVALTQSAL